MADGIDVPRQDFVRLAVLFVLIQETKDRIISAMIRHNNKHYNGYNFVVKTSLRIESGHDLR